MTDRKLFFTSFLILGFLALFYFLYGIFAPFMTSLMAAGMIVLIFHPIYRWILSKVNGHETLATFLMCLSLSLFVLLPTVILAMLVFQELLVGAEALTAWAQDLSFSKILNHPLVAKAVTFLKRFEVFRNVNFRDQLVQAAEQASGLLLGLSTGFFVLFSNFLFLTALIELNMFFLFRDGTRFVAYLKSLLPLSAEAKATLTRRIDEVIRSSILGTFATAGANGILGGLIFMFLGLPSPLLWGVIMFILAFIPLVGATVIWAPTALYLMFSGQITKGIILVTWAVITMLGFADYMVRPLLLKKIATDEIKLNTLVLFLSIMGGMQAYGLLGIVIGPLIMVVALTVFEMYRLYFHLPSQESLQEGKNLSQIEAGASQDLPQAPENR